MANPTVLKLGAWNMASDTFVAHSSSPTSGIIDLNDGITWSIVDTTGLGGGLELGQIAPSVYTGGNPRTIGKRVTKRIYDSNRVVTANLFLGQTTTYTQFQTALHNLIQLCEGITFQFPAALKIQTTLASTAYYADILEAHLAVDYKEIEWMQLLDDGIKIMFTCKPFFRGDRQTLQNLISNPGFERPSSTGTQVFLDSFANFDAYTLAGSAYRNELVASGPTRFYRMSEASGTTVTEAMNTGFNGTITGGVTLGVTGPLSGDTDTGMTFNGTTGYITANATGLPTGANPWSMVIWCKIASNPGSAATLFSYGLHSTAHGAPQFTMDTSGRVAISDGTTATPVSSALSLNTWHMLVGTYDGVNLNMYIDGVIGNNNLTTVAVPGSSTFTTIGASALASPTRFFPGSLAEATIFSGELGATEIGILYSIGVGTFATTSLVQDKFTYADTVIADSPLYYYRLDEASGTSAYDAIGHNVGTLNGGITLGSTGLLTGDTDTAMTFNGTTGYIQLVNTGTWPLGNGAWTIECWCKPTNNTNAKNGHLITIGNPGTNASAAFIAQNAAGGWNVGTWGGATHDFTGSGTSTGGTIYHVAATYDGTSITLYVNNTAFGPFVPTTVNLTRVHQSIGDAWGGAAQDFFFVGVIDEVAIYNTALSAGRIGAHYTAGTNSPSSTANTMVIAASNDVAFGSTHWESIFFWQVRFRYMMGQTSIWYLHYIDISNFIAVIVNQTSMQYIQSIAGVIHNLSTGNLTLHLVNGMQYFLQFVQFPSISRQLATQLQVTILADSGIGTPGSQVGQLAQVITADDSTSITGRPQIAVTGATLPIGGNFAGVQNLSVYGPGNWSWVSLGTGAAFGAWQQDTSQTYSGGPVESTGAVSITAAASGTLNGTWSAGDSLNLTTIKATASAATGSHAYYASAYMKSSGVGSGCVEALIAKEYDISGTLLATTTVSSLTGNHASYTQLSGTWTTNSSCVYIIIFCSAVDGTAGSANGIITFDNVQLWDSSYGTSMPYSELSFPLSPAQLTISGLVGDVPAPCLLELGFNVGSTGLDSSGYISIFAGRRLFAGFNAQLVGSPYQSGNNSNQNYLVLDPGAWSGYYAKYANFANNSEPIFVSGLVEDYLGSYHFYTRAQALDTPASGQGLSVQAYLLRGAWLGGNRLGIYQGTIIYPFGSNNYQIADSGIVQLPPFTPLSQADNSLLYNTVGVIELNATTGFNVDWGALLPIDGELLAATFQNSNVGSLTNWIWTYFDGYAQYATYQGSVGWSNETYGVPNTTLAGGGAGVVTNTIPSINSVGNSIPHVDPTVGTSAQLGVNQWVIIANDDEANNLPMACQISYSPLYAAIK